MELQSHDITLVDTWTWPDSSLARVVDGDTFVANLYRDMGFHANVSWQQKLRLNRINASPLETDAGLAARKFLVTTLSVVPAFLIETVGAYKYGDEWMAELTLPDGTNMSDLMISSGNAVYWNGTGPRPGG